MEIAGASAVICITYMSCQATTDGWHAWLDCKFMMFMVWTNWMHSQTVQDLRRGAEGRTAKAAKYWLLLVRLCWRLIGSVHVNRERIYCRYNYLHDVFWKYFERILHHRGYTPADANAILLLSSAVVSNRGTVFTTAVRPSERTSNGPSTIAARYS